MFNNTALDIAIGLTFIFVLYSLLALTINEFLATIFAYRSRMLERALEQMLDGKNYGYHWWDKVANFFLWMYYFIKEKFSDKDEQNEEIKSLNAFLSKTDLSNPEIPNNGSTRFYYRRLKVNEKSLLFTANITDHPLYKRKAEKSFFFKKPAYLSADSFSDMLIDVLGNNRSSGSPILLKDIASFVNTQINNNPDLKKVLNLYIEQANGDLQRFKLLLENWFDDTMDRVSGWYKKQSYRRSIFIGFLIAITFNVSTINIVKKLSKDKEVRAALVKNASDYVKTHVIDNSSGTKRVASVQEKTPIKPAKDTTNQTDTTKKSQPATTSTATEIPKDSTKSNSSDPDFEEVKRKLRQIDSLYKNDIAENDSLLGLGWGDFGIADRKKKYSKDSADYKNDKIHKKPWRPWFETKIGNPFYKPSYVIRKTFTSPNLFLGFLITALAIALGAPFWFDLLNKFVNLRVSGTKPENTNNTVDTKTTRLAKKPDPTAKG